MNDVISEVRRLAAGVLGLPRDELDVDRPLQEQGLESFAAVRLHRRVADRTGVTVPLEHFVGASVRDLVAEVDARTGTTTADPTTPQRTLDPREPVDDPAASAPLTAIQAAYWVGRRTDLPLGGVATYYYHELDRPPGAQREADPVREVARLEAAWNRVVERHPMLRAIVDHDARQRVLPSGRRYRIVVTDLRATAAGEAEQTLGRMRHELSHQARDPETWPLYDLQAAVLPDATLRLFVGFDILLLDMAGWILIMRQWGELVDDPDAVLPRPAADFLTLVRGGATAADERDRNWWCDRAAQLPPAPRLATTRPPEQMGRPRFRRHAGRLSADTWDALRAGAAARGLSPTAVLLAAYALTLHRWGAGTEFCLNTTLFDRPPELTGDTTVVGDFSSTLLVALGPVDLTAHAGFGRFAAAVNARFWADLEHRSFSGVQVQRELARRDERTSSGVSADPASVAVRYPYVFTSGVGLGQAGEPATARLGTEVFGVSQTPQILLDHIVWDEAGALRFAWDAVDDAFPAGLIEGMLEAHLALLTRLASEDGAWERADLDADPTFRPEAAPPPPLPGGPLLDDPQRATAVHSPTRPAVITVDGELTHDALRHRADALGDVLRATGVGPGAAVAVVLPKSPAQVVAILGILAAGAVYVPVEPTWPAPRIAAVCRRASIAHAVLADSGQVAIPDGVAAVTVDDAGATVGRPGTAPTPTPATSPRPVAASDLAYVIFTSGSSGEPKGVAIEHRAARTTIDDVGDRFGIGPDDRVLALSAASFDLSVWDLFGVLGAGGAVVLPCADRERDPGHWAELVERHAVTVWNTAPAVLEMMVEYAEADPGAAQRLRGLRLVMLSGDWIPVTLPDRLRALAPHATVMSLGGATEASIWSITHPIGDIDPSWASIPYGRALRRQSFHVLDPDGRPCPVGTTGELFIGGDGLAREYVGDPDQTADRFAEHPSLGRRLYRTGDLGRWQFGGTIEFLGRVDRQVKIRGHRIELGEIEAVIGRTAGVRQCVAAAVRSADGRPQLVGYVCGHQHGTPSLPTVAELSGAVAAQLPPFMVPSRWVVLDAMPLSSNGKIDVARLPDPFRTRNGGTPVRPATAPLGSHAPAPLPPAGSPSPVLPAATVGTAVGGWLERAVDAARRRGLTLTLRAGPGGLPAADALRAAGEWLVELEADARSRALDVTPGLPPIGLAELVLPVREDAAMGPEPGDAAAGAPAPADSARGLEKSRPEDQRPFRDLEVHIATAFSTVLGTEVTPGMATTPVGDLGATSLSLVLVHRRLRDLAPELTLLDLFGNPTVRSLAARITRLAPVSPDEPGEPGTGVGADPGAEAPPPATGAGELPSDLSRAATRGRRRAQQARTTSSRNHGGARARS